MRETLAVYLPWLLSALSLVPGYYDSLIMGRAPEPWEKHAARLASTLSLMRQLYEEVSGHGFYRPEREAEYAKLAAIDAAAGKGEAS